MIYHVTYKLCFIQPERYRPVATEVISRFSDDADSKIRVQEITLPDLSIPKSLGRREPFSLFIPAHRKMAARLIDILMGKLRYTHYKKINVTRNRSQGMSLCVTPYFITGMRTFDDFLSASVYCRDTINPNMFIYALSVAILHRPDTKDLPIPPLSEVLPGKFMDSGVFSRAKEEANLVPAGARVSILRLIFYCWKVYASLLKISFLF